MSKTYEIKPLKAKQNSAFKYRLYVNGLAKTCYETLEDAHEHVKVLKQTKVLRNATEETQWVITNY